MEFSITEFVTRQVARERPSTSTYQYTVRFLVPGSGSPSLVCSYTAERQAESQLKYVFSLLARDVRILPLGVCLFWRRAKPD